MAYIAIRTVVPNTRANGHGRSAMADAEPGRVPGVRLLRRDAETLKTDVQEPYGKEGGDKTDEAGFFLSVFFSMMPSEHADGERRCRRRASVGSPPMSRPQIPGAALFLKKKEASRLGSNLLLLCHNYIGHSYTGHNGTGHNYIRYSYIGHTGTGHTYIGND